MTFGLNIQEAGGVNVLIFSSTIRLDLSNQGCFLDAAVVPLEDRLARSKNNLDLLQDMHEKHAIGGIVIEPDELELLKHALLVFAERCRTRKHKKTCEYIKAGRIPFTTEYAKQSTCSCGMGVFPDGYFKEYPEWKALSKFAVHVAIAPAYPSPIMPKNGSIIDLPTRTTPASASMTL